MRIAPLPCRSVLVRSACLALIAALLSGCVVVPAYHYHPYPRGYYY
jgi:hypothetical protein